MKKKTSSPERRQTARIKVLLKENAALKIENENLKASLIKSSEALATATRDILERTAIATPRHEDSALLFHEEKA